MLLIRTASLGPDERIEIDRGIALMETVGLSWRALPWRAARDGRINLLEMRRSDAFPTDLTEIPGDVPLLCLLGDDDYSSSGPSGWKATQDLLGWASCAILHAAAGDLDTYEMGILLAEIVGRLVFVETDTAHVEQWAAACEHVGLQYIAISPGAGHHPVEPSSAERL